MYINILKKNYTLYTFFYSKSEILTIENKRKYISLNFWFNLILVKNTTCLLDTTFGILRWSNVKHQSLLRTKPRKLSARPRPEVTARPCAHSSFFQMQPTRGRWSSIQQTHDRDFHFKTIGTSIRFPGPFAQNVKRIIKLAAPFVCPIRGTS